MRRSKGPSVQGDRMFDKNWVTVGENESLESAIKRFKKKVDEEGVIKTYRDKQYFMKPSMKRRIAQKESTRKEKQRQHLMEKKLSYANNIK